LKYNLENKLIKYQEYSHCVSRRKLVKFREKSRNTILRINSLNIDNKVIVFREKTC